MTATALLPAFLPTALPPPSTSDGSTTASSTVGDDMDGAMDRLSLDGNPQQQAQAQAQTPSQQQHPLPPRPQVSRGYNPYLGMPPYGGYGPPPPHHEPPWATAYPLPPAYSSHPTGDALGLHGPPGLVPQQPLYMTSATHAPTPYIARPHPFLHRPMLYVSFVPTDMVADDFEQPLRRQGITPLAVRIPDAVKPVHRAYPDSYYDWMTKNGCLEFKSLMDTEKAYSILVSHPYFTSKNVLFSPLPPPQVAPLPPVPVAPRFIRPLKKADSEGTTAYPQPGELWDYVRPWGSIREVSVVLEETHVADAETECRWRAKVQFWWEDEASRFETNNSSTFAGWEIEVFRDPSYIPMAPMPFQPMGMFPQSPVGPPFPGMDNARPMSPPQVTGPLFPPPPMEQAATISDGGVPPLMIPPVYTEHFMYPPEMMRGMMPSSEAVMTPHGLVTSLWPVSPIPRIGGPGSESSIESAQSMGVSYIPAAVLGTTPPSPPNFPQVHYLPPPWAAQNSGLSHPMSPPYGPVDLPDAFPLPPIQHVNAWSHGKNWREVHGGFVSEDGHVIQHGWQSAKKVPSGRKPHADFNTLILKNLAPDVSTIFLAEQFGRFGEVVNARIPRDQFQRPRGFAYISFRFPEDAAKAITALNNTKIAGSRVSIAYKETRINNNVPTRGFPAARSRGAPRRNSLMSRDWPPLPKAAEALAKAAVPTPSATPSPVDTPSPSTTHSPKAASTAANVAAAKPPAPAGAVSAPCRMQPDAAPGNFEASTTNPKPVTLAVSYENVSVDSLGLMTPTNALGTIKGGGEDLLTRLGLYPRPIHIDKTASRKLSLVQAINPVVLQTPAVKGIATSRVVTCVRDFVNELSHEDEEALTQLLQYPPVVHVMIVHKLRARRTVPAFKGGLA